MTRAGLLLALVLVRGCSLPRYQLAFRTDAAGLVCGLVRVGEPAPFLTWTPPAGHGCEVSDAPAPYRWLHVAR